MRISKSVTASQHGGRGWYLLVCSLHRTRGCVMPPGMEIENSKWKKLSCFVRGFAAKQYTSSYQTSLTLQQLQWGQLPTMPPREKPTTRKSYLTSSLRSDRNLHRSLSPHHSSIHRSHLEMSIRSAIEDATVVRRRSKTAYKSAILKPHNSNTTYQSSS
jgi:hypothetical protein